MDPQKRTPPHVSKTAAGVITNSHHRQTLPSLSNMLGFMVKLSPKDFEFRLRLPISGDNYIVIHAVWNLYASRMYAGPYLM